MEVSESTNVESFIESTDLGDITAPPPVTISEIVQDVPVTPSIPEELDDKDTMSVESSQPETSKLIPEVLDVPLTNGFTTINKSLHIPHVGETATTRIEVETSSPKPDEQSTSIVAMNMDILSPPQDTIMDIDLPNTSQTVDHAN